MKKLKLLDKEVDNLIRNKINMYLTTYFCDFTFTLQHHRRMSDE